MPLPHPLESTLYGAFATSVLLQSDRLGLFACLCEKPVPMTAHEVAAALGTQPEATERLLLAAGSLGLLVRQQEGWFLTEELQTFLDPRSVSYIGPLLAFFRSNTVPLLPYLAEAVRTGKPQWERLGDPSRRSPFDGIYRDPDTARQFLGAMWQLGHGAAKELVSAPFFRAHRHLVDVGGATGSFAFAAAQAYPSLTAEVFDLPAVQPYFDEVARTQPAAPRVRFSGGDFWSDSIPAGDLYALGYILSDLDDEHSLILLRRLYDALPIGGRLLVLERLLEEKRTGPFDAVMQDLAMLLETGGRHRTARDYETLLNRAGFQACEAARSSGDKHMVIGVKQ